MSLVDHRNKKIGTTPSIEMRPQTLQGHEAIVTNMIAFDFKELK